SPGHPAEVVLRSDFIDLGATTGDNRSKVINHLSWDAELPAGTRLQMRSRSGNTQGTIYTFHNKIDEVVTEAQWNSLPKVLRGAIDTTIVASEDWDEWSEAYTFSGEAFKSQNPRRFVQLEMILSSDDPAVAPRVNSLVIKYEETFLQSALGSVEPRSTTPNEDTRFTYTLWPTSDAEDRGFDLLRFALPSAASDIEVHVGGAPVDPSAIDIRADSLFISLPFAVRTDSIETSFTTRVQHNATVFALDLGSSAHPGLWQSVEAAARRSNIVMLPDLIGATQLIGDFSISSKVLTPNGDGINDQVQIDFVAFKIERGTPHIQVFDLSGRSIVQLRPTATQGATHTFTWLGYNEAGELVQPGIYLYRIDLGAETGEDTALRSISVAY
ncbi:MAG: hypothetical protein ACI8P2_001588, partial [Candidatus Latescibacterota bacterium]